VLLCDFGLARVKADITTRTAMTDAVPAVGGSRYWMAPERLTGKPLRNVYAFGITSYEVILSLSEVCQDDIISCAARCASDLHSDRPKDDD
jgi:serine/threonine protein kinase